MRVVLDGGECKIGLESTIVSCDGARRAAAAAGRGHAGADSRSVLGDQLAASEAEVPRVPGSTPSHYAPITPTDATGG